MTIDTQHLRDLIRRAVPLPWALATSNSYRRIVRADRYEEVCSPVTMPDGHPDLWFPDGAEGPTAQLLIEASNALPDLLDIIEVLEGQVAEYARMLEKQSAEADARIEAQAAELHHIRNIPARTDQDRRMYAKGYAAARKKEQSKVDAANLVVVRAVDRCVDRDAEIAEAKSQIEHLDRQNNALRAALKPLAEIDLAAPPPNDFAWFVLRARAALQEQS